MCHDFCQHSLHGVVLLHASCCRWQNLQRHADAGHPEVLLALQVVNAWHDMQQLPLSCMQHWTTMYSMVRGEPVVFQRNQNATLPVRAQRTPLTISGLKKMGPGWRLWPQAFAPQASVMASSVRDDVSHEYTCFMRRGEGKRLHGRFYPQRVALRSFDRGEKFRRYWTWLPTLADYILVAQDQPLVEHYHRQEDGPWTLHTLEGFQA